MAYSFDHRVIVKYVNMRSSPQSTAFQQSFTEELDKLIRDIPAAVEALHDSEGWFINSHSLAFAGSTAIISVLLQRALK